MNQFKDALLDFNPILDGGGLIVPAADI